MIRSLFSASLVAYAGRALVTLIVLLTSVWGCLALWYQLPFSAAGKVAVASVWVACSLIALVFLWRRHATQALLGWLIAFLLLLAWWSTIQPSQTRPWADDVARQLAFHRDGDVVTLDNVRNFAWRSDTDYDIRWETRQYDLSRLASVDVAVSYWSGPAIAHTLVSFGFDDGRYLTFSIEIRKERDESFSSVGGFFKEFETSLIAADEHDILRVRSNVRGEDVYLYRVRLPADAMRSLFLAYLGEADLLRREARFYNTLTANCTTVVYELARRIVPGLPLDYRLLASGYLPEYLHDVGGLTPGVTMSALRAAGRITDRAIATDSPRAGEVSRDVSHGVSRDVSPEISRDVSREFSREIRRGVPGVDR